MSWWKILDAFGGSLHSARFGFEKSAILGPSGYSNEQFYISLKFQNCDIGYLSLSNIVKLDRINDGRAVWGAMANSVLPVANVGKPA